MTKKKYYVITKKIEKIEFNPKGDKFIFSCCDCGLTHNIGVALEKNGKIGLAFELNRLRTKNNRDSWKKKEY